MSDSVRPHRRQPTRLPRPWASPGKNTGVGCHFLFQCTKVKSEKSEVAQSCLTPSDPMDCSPPGSSVHGNFPGKGTGVGCHCLLHLEGHGTPKSGKRPVTANLTSVSGMRKDKRGVDKFEFILVSYHYLLLNPIECGFSLHYSRYLLLLLETMFSQASSFRFSSICHS